MHLTAPDTSARLALNCDPVVQNPQPLFDVDHEEEHLDSESHHEL